MGVIELKISGIQNLFSKIISYRSCFENLYLFRILCAVVVVFRIFYSKTRVFIDFFTFRSLLFFLFIYLLEYPIQKTLAQTRFDVCISFEVDYTLFFSLTFK